MSTATARAYDRRATRHPFFGVSNRRKAQEQRVFRGNGARRACIKDNVLLDPCCGSGGLLLKFSKILGVGNVRNGFFGQEVNLTTYNLARMNMFLHDINFDKFDIVHEDTLKNPAHWDDQPFDAIDAIVVDLEGEGR